MAIAELGNYYIIEDLNSVDRYVILKRGEQFDTEIARYFRYGQAENKLIKLTDWR